MSKNLTASVPEAIELLDVTREVNEIRGLEQYRIEEHTFVDLVGTRFITLTTGSIPGTMDLCGYEDVVGTKPDWTMVLMGLGRPRYYALAFEGCETKCLDDIMMLRLVV